MAFFKIRKGGSDPVAAAAATPAESVEALRRRARQRLIGAAVLVLAWTLYVSSLIDIDHQIIPAIIEAINNYKPKPKRDPKWPVMAKAAVAAVARRVRGEVAYFSMEGTSAALSPKRSPSQESTGMTAGNQPP